jgi:tetratricopeptide (TPR) repeat protein
MTGQNSALRARLGEFTALLRQGQPTEQAFTNAFRTPLPGMETQLRQYLQQGRFTPLGLAVHPNLLAAQPLVTRALSAAETSFRLGDELLRVGRSDVAERYFLEAKKMAPASPLAYEGLGFLAASRGQHDAALEFFQESLERRSTSFLAHYAFAREKFRLTAKRPDTYSRIGQSEATEIRTNLTYAISVMPAFAPAHHLLGFLELLQGEQPGLAEEHLRLAIKLEPENQSYSLSLAQAQLLRNEFEAARETLQPLCLPTVDSHTRQTAQELLEQATRPRVERR